LLLDHRTRRLVAVDAAEQFGGHAAVRALRAVLVIDVEQHVFSAGGRFARHGFPLLGRSPGECLARPRICGLCRVNRTTKQTAGKAVTTTQTALTNVPGNAMAAIRSECASARKRVGNS